MINRRNVLKSSSALAAGGLVPVAAAGKPRSGGGSGLRPGERYVDVPGGRVWVNVVGSGRRPALLVLHGGPGAGHDYL
ncbi:twin-arginine translocation signal domain-containing protein [Streptomyces pseudovenezuelae]|uniref:Alpha/beta hydrolase n=1 Tax=Streptomyces pseudovenezuelae TaxID=67350 RepID=A0ABT6LT31_9ACTN|nr:twin-arginine translocation signal domain-containing protein [Streptomyces pseudovenezuelae]MDH6218944.1 hypothetical protein [Streptomyces pseudovenezuelae]